MDFSDSTIILSPPQAIPPILRKTIQVVAVTGGKGGIGKTNVAVNLAIALAKRKQKVMVFDGDLSLANVDVLLGLPVKYNLSHVLQGECALSDICVTGPEGIVVVPATSGLQHMADLNVAMQRSIIDAFSDLTMDIDTLVIDTAAGIGNNVVGFAQAAHEIIVLVCHEPTAIADAYALIKLLSQKYSIQRFRILVNMVRYAEEGMEVYQKIYNVASRFLNVKLQYLGALPFDEHLRLAVRQHRAVIDEYPGSKAAMAIKELARIVSQWQPPEVAQQGRLSFFFDRLVRAS